MYQNKMAGKRRFFGGNIKSINFNYNKLNWKNFISKLEKKEGFWKLM